MDGDKPTTDTPTYTAGWLLCLFGVKSPLAAAAGGSMINCKTVYIKKVKIVYYLFLSDQSPV